MRRSGGALAAAVVCLLLAAPAASGAASTITGTVTDPNGDPLAGICVTADGSAGPPTSTASDGTYTLTVDPGDYLVSFDDCGTLTYVPEYYDDAPDASTAMIVPVAADSVTPGIDAQLALLPPDSTPPDTSIFSSPPASSTSQTATFGFTSDDPDAAFECSLDGSAFSECSSPQQYTGLTDGPHHFEVRAIDPVGNVDPVPETVDFTVDSAAPDTIISAGPSGTINTRAVTFDFTSTEGSVGFLCQLDGNSGPCSSPKAYSSLADGPHTFSVFATDQAGNADQSPATRSFYVDMGGNPDLDPPETTIDAGPEGTITSSGTAFYLSSDEPGSTFECALDDGPYESCTTPSVLTGLSDGDHVFSVKATDPAGNHDTTPATRSFAVDTHDTTPPETTIDSGPSGTIAEDFASFTFSSSEDGSTFECQFDGGGWSPCDPPRAYNTLTDGSHTFEVQALDAAANVDSTPASRTFTVDTSLPLDTTPPETTIQSGPSGTIAQSSASFTFDSSENGSTFECQLDGGGFSPCQSPQPFTGLADASHTFEVQALDPAGNRDASPDTRTFAVDTAPPETTIQSGPSGTIAQSSASFAFDSGDTGATFACKLDGGGYAPCASPRNLTGLADGNHTFEVQALDPAGNRDASPDTRTFAVDTAPPETTIQSGPSGTIAQSSASFAFDSTENGSTFECRLDGGAFSACASPRGLSGLAEGSHTFEAKATDAVGNHETSPATRTFAVDTAPPETTIQSGPSGTISSSSTAFAFSSPEGGSAFQCKLDAGGYSPCTSPTSLTGLANGAHTFSVRAIDSAGNADASAATRTFTVQTTTTTPPPDPPATDPACTDAQSQLASAETALRKAKAKLKKAKSKPAKKKAKTKVKKAKTKVNSAESAVAASC